MFLVIVGENGCWLAGFGVIYSANELPLVVVKLSLCAIEIHIFQWVLVNIKLIKI